METITRSLGAFAVVLAIIIAGPSISALNMVIENSTTITDSSSFSSFLMSGIGVVLASLLIGVVAGVLLGVGLWLWLLRRDYYY